MASGTAVAGAGAVIGTLGWVQAEQSASAAGVWASAPTVPGAEGAYQDAELQYLAGRRQVRVGQGVALVGSAAMVIGLVDWLGR